MAQKVTIITTTYNDGEHLEEVARAVYSQDYENIEYIIVNGGDDAKTDEVIEKVRNLFGDRLKVIKEHDKGIYDAINKGIRAATGDIIGCCFDFYASDNVISRFVDIIEKEGTDGVHADLNYVKDGRIVRRWHQGTGSIRSGWMPGHPTLYLKRKIYKKFGLYKEDYKVAADYEFMVRILGRKKVRLSYIPEVMINMNYGGTSNNSFGAYMLSLKEGHRALKENDISFACVTDALRIVRVLTQFSVR